ncbi:MAG: rod shape-determining protein MreD [Firmicutes bacterium]|nr:rod shape-determining protein MreD [Bacillota bacterium]
MSGRRVFRWILYFLELIAVYVLQTTPGIIPAVSGARPVLLIPAALTIAMFEGDIGGMAVGIAAGLLIDMGGSDILGFHAIVLAILCFVLGSMTMQIFRTNLLVALLAAVVAVPVVIVLQWVFFYILPGYGDLQYVFLGSILPKMVYTFAVTPLFYLFNRVIALRLSEAA